MSNLLKLDIELLETEIWAEKRQASTYTHFTKAMGLFSTID